MTDSHDTILIVRPTDRAVVLKRLVKSIGRRDGWDCVAVLPEDPLSALEYLLEQVRQNATGEAQVCLSNAMAWIRVARRKAREGM